MNATVFKYAVVAAIILVGIGAGAWYLLAPPDVALQKTPAPKQNPGTIEGTTLYPSEFNPAQHVCAQSVSDPSYERCTDTPEQTTDVPTFSIKVAPGSYYVFAVLKDPGGMGLEEETRAYYTEFVTCGLRSDCPSHKHIEVVVGSGQTVSDIRPHDWYDTR